jgi:predicted kinase
MTSGVAAEVLGRLPDLRGRWRGPVLVALMGPPGTGKTEIAGYLARRFPLTVLSTDAIRLRHGLPSGPATHEVIYEVASVLLPAGGGVVWDGIHPTRRHRATVRGFAAHHGARFELVCTAAAADVVRRRLAARAATPEATAAEGKFVIAPAKLAELATWYEPLDREEPATLVDTTAGEVGDQLDGLEGLLGTLMAP